MPSSRPALAWFLLPLVVTGFAAVWTLAALYSGRQCSFMAVVGAVDVLWTLGLLGALGRVWKAAVAVVATAVLVVLANWAIVAINVGASVTHGPLDAMLRLGRHHAWLMAQLANGAGDVAWIAIALGIAAVGPWFSGRRPAPSAR